MCCDWRWYLSRWPVKNWLSDRYFYKYNNNFPRQQITLFPFSEI